MVATYGLGFCRPHKSVYRDVDTLVGIWKCQAGCPSSDLRSRLPFTGLQKRPSVFVLIARFAISLKSKYSHGVQTDRRGPSLTTPGLSPAFTLVTTMSTL